MKLDDYVTVAQAADELGLSPSAVRQAIHVGTINVLRLNARTNLVPREEVERYRRDYLGTRGIRHGQRGRDEQVRRLYRQHYHGGRGRNTKWDDGWDMRRIAKEVGLSVSRARVIANTKQQEALRAGQERVG